MSAFGQKRTNHREPKSTVVRFSPKADKHGYGWIVRFVPGADIRAAVRYPLYPQQQTSTGAGISEFCAAPSKTNFSVQNKSFSLPSVDSPRLLGWAVDPTSNETNLFVRQCVKLFHPWAAGCNAATFIHFSPCGGGVAHRHHTDDLRPGHRQ